MIVEPKWLDVDTLIRLHDQGLLRYGGPAGLRDAGLLSSALQRPLNRWSYEGVEEIEALAATYGGRRTEPSLHRWQSELHSSQPSFS